MESAVEMDNLTLDSEDRSDLLKDIYMKLSYVTHKVEEIDKKFCPGLRKWKSWLKPIIKKYKN